MTRRLTPTCSVGLSTLPRTSARCSTSSPTRRARWPRTRWCSAAAPWQGSSIRTMPTVRQHGKRADWPAHRNTLTPFSCIPARRLAMYQEMDSEEEECTSHGGTLPRRDSVSSHHSARVVLRSQSTKSHRRTGSRAEAKRASILSKHTAFSSPMVCSQCSPARLFSTGFVFPASTPIAIACYAIIYLKKEPRSQQRRHVWPSVHKKDRIVAFLGVGLVLTPSHCPNPQLKFLLGLFSLFFFH